MIHHSSHPHHYHYSYSFLFDCLLHQMLKIGVHKAFVFFLLFLHTGLPVDFVYLLELILNYVGLSINKSSTNINEVSIKLTA